LKISEKLVFSLRRFYMKNIFYRMRERRGFTRVKMVLDSLAERYAEKSEKPEFDVFEKDWDNLLILDACRLDLYEEVEGETKGRTSLGSSTAEFVKKNFSEGDFSDTVYVTGNPHFSKKLFSELTGRDPDETFHEVFHTYMSDWDAENGTVLPEPLIRDAETAKKLFPDKRIVVHFMQPHYPFVGSNLVSDAGISQQVDKKYENVEDQAWVMTETGKVSKDKIWKAYRENLEYILDEIEDFTENLEGKTLVTSDHGNAVGESTFYGHPKGVNTKELREVPWYELS
jgi:hypothetical protein